MRWTRLAEKAASQIARFFRVNGICRAWVFDAKFFQKTLLLLPCAAILAFFVAVAGECPAYAAGFTTRPLFTIPAGNGEDQVTNTTMEGGMPYGPVSMASDGGRVFYIAEPMRFRVSKFDRTGQYLGSLKGDELYGLSKVMFSSRGFLLAVVNGEDASSRLMVYDRRGVPRAIIDPAGGIGGDSLVIDFELVNDDTVLAILESGGLLYGVDGRFLRSVPGPFVDARGYTHLLDPPVSPATLVIQNPQGVVSGRVPLPFTGEGEQELFELLRDGDGIVVSKLVIPGGNRHFYRYSADGILTASGSSETFSFAGAEGHSMSVPYPPGGVTINETVKDR